MTYFENIKNYFEALGETPEQINTSEELELEIFRRQHKRLKDFRKGFEGPIPKDYLDVDRASFLVYEGQDEGECDYVNDFYLVLTDKCIMSKNSYKLDTEDTDTLNEDFIDEFSDWYHEYSFLKGDKLTTVKVQGDLLDPKIFIVIEEGSKKRDYMILKDDENTNVFSSLAYGKSNNPEKEWRYRLAYFDETGVDHIVIKGDKVTDSMDMNYVTIENTGEVTFLSSAKIDKSVSDKLNEDIKVLGKYVKRMQYCDSKIKEYEKDNEEEMPKIRTAQYEIELNEELFTDENLDLLEEIGDKDFILNLIQKSKESVAQTSNQDEDKSINL